MTCIVAVKSAGGIVMGADAATGIVPWKVVLPPTERPKIFSPVSGVIIGCSGSPRLGNILQYRAKILGRADRIEPEEWMYSCFIPKLRDVLKAEGLSKIENNQEGDIGEILVAEQSHLWRIAGDFQALLMADYTTIGSGLEVALGSLHTTGSTNLKLSPESRVLMALRAAVAHSAYIRPPFTLLGTGAFVDTPGVVES